MAALGHIVASFATALEVPGIPIPIFCASSRVAHGGERRLNEVPPDLTSDVQEENETAATDRSGGVEPEWNVNGMTLEVANPKVEISPGPHGEADESRESESQHDQRCYQRLSFLVHLSSEHPM
jgi:hypothetical protein